MAALILNENPNFFSVVRSKFLPAVKANNYGKFLTQDSLFFLSLGGEDQGEGDFKTGVSPHSNSLPRGERGLIPSCIQNDTNFSLG